MGGRCGQLPRKLRDALADLIRRGNLSVQIDLSVVTFMERRIGIGGGPHNAKLTVEARRSAMTVEL
jgi:hypothetical protein